MSLPSTRTPGTPYASPLIANDVLAVWRSQGTLIAQPLLRQKKTVAVLNTPAKFIPLVELVRARRALSPENT